MPTLFPLSGPPHQLVNPAVPGVYRCDGLFTRTRTKHHVFGAPFAPFPGRRGRTPFHYPQPKRDDMNQPNTNQPSPIPNPTRNAFDAFHRFLIFGGRPATPEDRERFGIGATSYVSEIGDPVQQRIIIEWDLPFGESDQTTKIAITAFQFAHRDFNSERWSLRNAQTYHLEQSYLDRGIGGFPSAEIPALDEYHDATRRGE